MNEPTDNKANEQFAEQARALFDESVEQLDAAALSRLNQGRHAAFDALQGVQPAAIWGRWVPASGVAAVALVTVMIMRGPDKVDLPNEMVTEMVTDFEILLEGESLEMLEDLEFYSWLEASDLEANGNVG